MFTGLIEEKGKVQAIRKGIASATLTISSSVVTGDLKVGDSVSVNGVCLTATLVDKHTFSVDAVPETMLRSNLGSLHAGSVVNLERALKVGDRLGGHMVSGHVDALGQIKLIEGDENAVWFTVTMDPHQLKYLVPKGSVAIDGISLTVVEVTADAFTVSVIPHSLKETTLADKVKEDKVNIECDMTAKYIEKFLGWKEKSGQESPVSMDYLKKHGFA
jgi:riboflavin synthase